MNTDRLIGNVIAAAEYNILLQTGCNVKLGIVKDSEAKRGAQEILVKVACVLKMRMTDYQEDRRRPYVDLRTIAAMMIRKHYAWASLKQIGDLMGGMNHASILNYQTRGRNLLETCDEIFTQKYVKVSMAMENWIKEERNEEN